MPVTGEFPLQCQWNAALFSLICASANGWVNNLAADDFRRHFAHYYVIVMSARIKYVYIEFANFFGSFAFILAPNDHKLFQTIFEICASDQRIYSWAVFPPHGLRLTVSQLFNSLYISWKVTVCDTPQCIQCNVHTIRWIPLVFFLFKSYKRQNDFIPIPDKTTKQNACSKLSGNVPYTFY